MAEFIIIVIVIGVILGILKLVVESNGKKTIEASIKALPDFNASQVLTAYDGGSALAVDTAGRKVALLEAISLKVPTGSSRVVSYRDILSCEILEDGDSITKTARMSQAGGALLGAVAFGGVGAIIGGLSGKTVSSKKVEKLALLLIVNDPAKPRFEVKLNSDAMKNNSMLYKPLLENARHWHSVISVLIRQADDEDKKEETTNRASNSAGPSSLSDELVKLKALRDDGTISQAEFDSLKTKLLSM